MHTTVHEVVYGQHQPWLDLPLHADIDLRTVWRFVMRVQDVSGNHTLVNIELWWRARNWPVCRELRACRDVRVLRCNNKRDGGAQRRANATVWSGCTRLRSRAIRRRIK